MVQILFKPIRAVLLNLKIMFWSFFAKKELFSIFKNTPRTSFCTDQVDMFVASLLEIDKLVLSSALTDGHFVKANTSLSSRDSVVLGGPPPG